MNRNELADKMERFVRGGKGMLGSDDILAAIAALRDVEVTDAMVDVARDAYWVECEYTTGKFGMRKALEAALSPKAAQGETADGWLPIASAPQNETVLGVVDGDVRLIRWCKTSHVPIYGWNLADQGAEEFEICHPALWQPLPPPPKTAPSGDEADRNIAETNLGPGKSDHPKLVGDA